MRVRAFHDLAQLSDADFLREISAGLRHISRNVIAIDADARHLARESHGRGARILDAFAAEEAGKFMILLDAVRCARRPQERLAAQLRKAGLHLPKILYSELCHIRPVNFAEVKRWIAMESQQFYLDGPSGADWVYRNRMVQSRENTLYVDYIAAEGDHYWNLPDQMDESLVMLSSSPASVRMVTALSSAGFSSETALILIAGKWRSIAISDDTDIHALRRWNIATLEMLEAQGTLLERPSTDYSLIAGEWPYPLYDLPLMEIRVDMKALEAERRRYTEG